MRQLKISLKQQEIWFSTNAQQLLDRGCRLFCLVLFKIKNVLADITVTGSQQYARPAHFTARSMQQQQSESLEQKKRVQMK